MFTDELPFLRKPDCPTALQGFCVTLLGPTPRLNTILRFARKGVKPNLQYIESQKNVLNAYRAKVVALIKILEHVAQAPGPATAASRAAIWEAPAEPSDSRRIS